MSDIIQSLIEKKQIFIIFHMTIEYFKKFLHFIQQFLYLKVSSELCQNVVISL